jgi:hypothetical protein
MLGTRADSPTAATHSSCAPEPRPCSSVPFGSGLVATDRPSLPLWTRRRRAKRIAPRSCFRRDRSMSPAPVASPLRARQQRPEQSARSATGAQLQQRAVVRQRTPE